MSVPKEKGLQVERRGKRRGGKEKRRRNWRGEGEGKVTKANSRFQAGNELYGQT